LLPHGSVALQVRVALKVVPQRAFVVVLTMAIATFVPLQASSAVGGSKFQVVPHSKVRGGAHTIIGGMVSTTVTVCVQVVTFAQSLLASQIRVAMKVLPQSPFVKVLRIVTEAALVPPPFVSTVGGSKFQTVVHSTVLFGWQTSTGGLVLTVKHVAVAKFE